MRAWWHVQRVLLGWGIAATALHRRPTTEEMLTGYSSEATYFRDLRWFVKVFPEFEPYDLWLQIAGERNRREPMDVVSVAVWP
jgi:hypothetical protein